LGIAGNALTALFKPDPPVPVTISDPAEIRAQFRHWRFRVLSATIVGYAIFYFVRANLPIAMPDMKKSLGVNNAELGLFLTLSGVLYGV
jgi:sugar phosphate permease